MLSAQNRLELRALTEDELIRLLDAARTQPLHDAQGIRRGKHRGELRANVRPETRRRLQRCRALQTSSTPGSAFTCAKER